MSRWNDTELRAIYEHSNGKCHLCFEPMKYEDYGLDDNKGWEVEHSVAQAEGGTDHKNNLYPAHRPCNRAKGTRTSQEVRAEKGFRRPPRSKQQAEQRQANFMAGGAAALALFGGLTAGPLGVLGGLLFGAIGGHALGDEDDGA